MCPSVYLDVLYYIRNLQESTVEPKFFSVPFSRLSCLHDVLNNQAMVSINVISFYEDGDDTIKSEVLIHNEQLRILCLFPLIKLRSQSFRKKEQHQLFFFYYRTWVNRHKENIEVTQIITTEKYEEAFFFIYNLNN